MTKSLIHIDINQGITQGVNKDGFVFGYDHARSNFITWGIDNDKIVVVKVEHDDDYGDQSHGSLTGTLLDARAVASIENKKTYSPLRISILAELVR